MAHPVIRPCTDHDIGTIHAIINDAAEAYRGVIPADRWHEPYMTLDELEREIAAGVRFWGYQLDGQLVGVMGIQDVQDVTLIRHAYVRTACRGRGIGGELLQALRANTDRPILIGTWAAATWAIGFYEKHGFRRVTPQEKDRLLGRYWSIPPRQVETSVVLADPRWLERSVSVEESTRQVLERHMEAVDSGDVQTILADYADDAVLLTPQGALRGRGQIRPTLVWLLEDVFTGDCQFTLHQQQIAGEVAYIVWSAQSGRCRIPLATDTFLIRAEKIVTQTFAAQIEEPKG